MEWYIWTILGIILIILELMSGTFLLLGLGVSSIVIGLINKVFDFPLTYSLALFSICSLLFFYIWNKWIKNERMSSTGQSDNNLDKIGIVTEEIRKDKRGKVKFSTPVLGSRVWNAITKSEEEIKKGETVFIVGVDGQLLKVDKLK